jgi:hypothetical protein
MRILLLLSRFLFVFLLLMTDVLTDHLLSRMCTPGGSGGDFGACVPILLLRLGVGAQDLGLGDRPSRDDEVIAGIWLCCACRGGHRYHGPSYALVADGMGCHANSQLRSGRISSTSNSQAAAAYVLVWVCMYPISYLSLPVYTIHAAINLFFVRWRRVCVFFFAN